MGTDDGQAAAFRRSDRIRNDHEHGSRDRRLRTMLPGCRSTTAISNLPKGERAMSPRSRRMVAIWLYSIAGMILVMVALGGATRVTGSGLSIMEWAPIMGTLPR